MTNVVVVGESGFIRSHVADFLSKEGLQVVNNILFALRQIEFNLSLKKESMCLMFKDFNDE